MLKYTVKKKLGEFRGVKMDYSIRVGPPNPKYLEIDPFLPLLFGHPSCALFDGWETNKTLI